MRSEPGRTAALLETWGAGRPFQGHGSRPKRLFGAGVQNKTDLVPTHPLGRQPLCLCPCCRATSRVQTGRSRAWWLGPAVPRGCGQGVFSCRPSPVLPRVLSLPRLESLARRPGCVWMPVSPRGAVTVPCALLKVYYCRSLALAYLELTVVRMFHQFTHQPHVPPPLQPVLRRLSALYALWSLNQHTALLYRGEPPALSPGGSALPGVAPLPARLLSRVSLGPSNPGPLSSVRRAPRGLSPGCRGAPPAVPRQGAPGGGLPGGGDE